MIQVRLEIFFLPMLVIGLRDQAGYLAPHVWESGQGFQILLPGSNNGF